MYVKLVSLFRLIFGNRVGNCYVRARSSFLSEIVDHPAEPKSIAVSPRHDDRASDVGLLSLLNDKWLSMSSQRLFLTLRGTLFSHFLPFVLPSSLFIYFPCATLIRLIRASTLLFPFGRFIFRDGKWQPLFHFFRAEATSYGASSSLRKYI